MAVSIAEVASIPAFSKLRPETLALLQRALVERTFPPGQLIFVEGERTKGLWFLREGRVKIFRTSLDGREQGLCLMRAGMCCGCPLFYGELNPASAEALDTVTVYLMEEAVVLDLAGRHPEVCQALFGVFARGEQVLSSLLVSLSCSRLIGRLAQVLLEQTEGGEAASSGGTRRCVGLSHEELACLVGTSREVVTRSLDRLQKAGVVELGRKQITILNPKKLLVMTR
jgi:CRP/FNR family transcriptional regulator